MSTQSGRAPTHCQVCDGHGPCRSILKALQHLAGHAHAQCGIAASRMEQQEGLASCSMRQVVPDGEPGGHYELLGSPRPTSHPRMCGRTCSKLPIASSQAGPRCRQGYRYRWQATLLTPCMRQ